MTQTALAVPSEFPGIIHRTFSTRRYRGAQVRGRVGVVQRSSSRKTLEKVGEEPIMNHRLQVQTILATAAAGLTGATGVAGQTETDQASAGNGGVGTASANGGAAQTGAINSGGNAGNAVGVGDTWDGSVGVSGGTMSNGTTLGLTVDGGTGIADASGGSYNLAFVS
jgi:hypothetical protein